MSKTITVTHEEPKLKVGSYISGFVLSLIFTLSAYTIVRHHSLTTDKLVGIVVGFALAQFLTQMFFFLHLGKETRPRWKLAVFFFMLGVVFILVFGSLWIMNNLNYRMTLPQQLQYMNSQNGF